MYEPVEWNIPTKVNFHVYLTYENGCEMYATASIIEGSDYMSKIWKMFQEHSQHGQLTTFRYNRFTWPTTDQS